MTCVPRSSASIPAPVSGSGDSSGVSMDTLQVTQTGATYLGVYHWCTDSGCEVRLATSSDLEAWRFRVTLDAGASQPYLRSDGGSGYVLAVESGTGNHVRLRHYRSLDDLLGARADRSFDASRTLSRCAEGTPTIVDVTPSGDTRKPDVDQFVQDLHEASFGRVSAVTVTSVYGYCKESRLNGIPLLGLMAMVITIRNPLWRNISRIDASSQVRAGFWGRLERSGAF
jgi:hypothetical protein